MYLFLGTHSHNVFACGISLFVDFNTKKDIGTHNNSLFLSPCGDTRPFPTKNSNTNSRSYSTQFRIGFPGIF